jgi:polysaccharide transporter, PST family
LSTQTARKLFSNFMNLSFLHLISYAIPLLVVPFVLRAIGLEAFGLSSFAIALAFYMQVVIDYGFNLSGVRECSAHRSDTVALSRVVSRIIAIKLLIFAPLLALYLVVHFVFGFDLRLFFIAFAGTFFSIFWTHWLYQALDKFGALVIIQVIVRIIGAVAMVTLLSDTGDAWLYVAISSAQMGLMALVCLYHLRQMNIRMILPSLDEIWTELKDSFALFVSTFCGATTMSAPIVLLGLFAHPAIVGAYSSAEKIVSAIRNVSWMAFQATYPHICANLGAKEALKELVGKVNLMLALIFIVVWAILLLFANFIMTLLIGSYNAVAIDTLKALSIIPLLSSLYITRQQLLLAHKYNSDMLKINLTAAGFGVVIIGLLSFLYSAHGAAFGVMLVEIMIGVTTFRAFNRRNIF